MKQKYFYRVTDCKMQSAHIGRFDLPKLKVTSEVDKWTIPKLKKSKLFVFKNLKTAKKFKNIGNLMGRIFVCIVKNPVKIERIINSGDIVTFMEIKQIKNFWNNKKIDEYYDNFYQEAPDGTYVVDAFKPIREIKKR